MPPVDVPIRSIYTLQEASTIDYWARLNTPRSRVYIAGDSSMNDPPQIKLRPLGEKKVVPAPSMNGPPSVRNIFTEPLALPVRRPPSPKKPPPGPHPTPPQPSPKNDGRMHLNSLKQSIISAALRPAQG
jgi:hypothetical protein